MWTWLSSFLAILGGAQNVDDTILDPVATWASNEVSKLVAIEPTWAQKPTLLIGNAIINFGETAVDTFLGVPPEHLVAIVTHATMNHPDVTAANPATINAGKMISPAKKAPATS